MGVYGEPPKLQSFQEVFLVNDIMRKAGVKHLIFPVFLPSSTIWYEMQIAKGVSIPNTHPSCHPAEFNFG